MTETRRERGTVFSTVLLLAAGLLAFEIVLMRVLLCASWHHFAFLVISVALLGFGASGSLLCLFRDRLLRHARAVLLVCALAAGFSMILALQLMPRLPLESRLLDALLAPQLLAWCAFWALAGLPFFAGGTGLGLGLMMAGPRLPSIYGANLLGSAVGVLLAALFMVLVPPRWLMVPAAGLTLLAALPLLHRRNLALFLATSLLAALWLAAGPPRLRVDSFKFGRRAMELVDQGEARLLAAAHGPRCRVEVFGGEVFHEMPFLSVESTPPRLSAIVVDGHWAGSLMKAANAGDAACVDETLNALPYELAPANPAVLLLGETGGANIWLGLRREAARVTAVQPSGEWRSLHAGPLRDWGSGVFDAARVRTITEDSRRYVDHCAERFDLIHLAGLESWATGAGGLAGLNQDQLATVEGLGACLDRLSAEGILSVCRAIQLPPRDNVKLLATLTAALRARGVANPAERIAVLRDYLGVSIMVKAAPWSAADIAVLRRICRDRQLSPVHFPGVGAEELNRPDRLPGPAGGAGDWLHHAATLVFAGEIDLLQATWPYDLRPPTDDRPYFMNFARTGRLGALRETFGEAWLARGELALFFVLTAASLITLCAFLLTVLPLILHRGLRRTSGKGGVLAYFTIIGLAYMGLEITLMYRMTSLLGEPVRAATVVIAVLLLFSGLGSLAMSRLPRPGSRSTLGIFSLIVLGALLTFRFLDPLSDLTGAWPLAGRVLAAGFLMAPLAFLMGLPMPLGLARLDRHAPPLLPWAWGLNGFASVLAPPLATAASMIWGFRSSSTAALLCYALAALFIFLLPSRRSSAI